VWGNWWFDWTMRWTVCKGRILTRFILISSLPDGCRDIADVSWSPNSHFEEEKHHRCGERLRSIVAEAVQDTKMASFLGSNYKKPSDIHNYWFLLYWMHVSKATSTILFCLVSWWWTSQQVLFYLWKAQKASFQQMMAVTLGGIELQW